MTKEARDGVKSLDVGIMRRSRCTNATHASSRFVTTTQTFVDAFATFVIQHASAATAQKNVLSVIAHVAGVMELGMNVMHRDAESMVTRP